MKPPLGHGLVFEVYELDSPPEWRWRLWDAQGSVVAVSGLGSMSKESCKATCWLFAQDVLAAQKLLEKNS